MKSNHNRFESLLLLLLLKYGDPGTVGPWIKGNLPSSPPIMVVLRHTLSASHAASRLAPSPWARVCLFLQTSCSVVHANGY